MIGQALKDAYFAFVRVATLPNANIARMRFARPTWSEGHYLHLGCGDDYIDGMINIDGNIRRRRDLWMDLRNPLPFRDSSAFFVYSSHMLEHLYPDDAQRLLREIWRILRPDGTCRLVVPSVEHALEIAKGYGASAWPRPSSDSLGQAVNYLFCDGQHKYAYSEGSLQEFSRRAGFFNITPSTTALATYGRITVGDEEYGSLVLILRR